MPSPRSSLLTFPGVDSSFKTRGNERGSSRTLSTYARPRRPVSGHGRRAPWPGKDPSRLRVWSHWIPKLHNFSLNLEAPASPSPPAALLTESANTPRGEGLGSPSAHPQSMNRERERQEQKAANDGRRSRARVDRQPTAPLAGATGGATCHPGAQAVADSGAHPLARPSSGGASPLVLTAQMACEVAG
jgi:hypothetical protein